MANKSKAKGNRYESHVAKMLSKLTGVVFRKVFGSGMINKGSGQVIAPDSFCGDVTCDRDDFMFSVEAKNRKSLVLPPLLYEKNSRCEFTSAWAQCVLDAEENNKLPMFFFKPNFNDDWILLDEKGIQLLEVSTIPRMVFEVYHSDLDLKVRRGKGTEEIVRPLPMPYVYRWKVLADHCNPSKMFEGGLEA